MKTKSRAAILLALAGGMFPASVVRAEQSFYGYTGLIQIPTAEVVRSGYMDLAISDDLLNQSQETDRRGRSGVSVVHQNLSMLVGLVPGLEVGALLATGDEASGRRIINDLGIRAKYSLPVSRQLAIAVGGNDFYGGNQSQKRAKAAYGVATYQYTPKIALTAGLGKADDDFLDGPFAGVRYKPVRQIELLADGGPESFQFALRASLSRAQIGSLYGMYKGYASEFNKTATSLGAQINLDTNDWFRATPDFGGLWSGLQNKRIRPISNRDGVVIESDALGYRWSEQDAVPELCKGVAPGTKMVVRRAMRYGVPVYFSQLDCDTGTQSNRAWSPTRLSDLKVLLHGWRSLPGFVEIRFNLDDRSVVGTESGPYEYSDALLTSARLQLPLGLAGYATYEQPLAQSKTFEENGAFSFQRHDEQMRESAVQLAMHPYPGLFSVSTIGLTQVNAFQYTFQHTELAMHFWQGLVQTRLTYGIYHPDSPEFFELPTNRVRLVSVEGFIPSIRSSVEVSYGDFFYRDSGVRITASRHFGPSIVSLVYRQVDEGFPKAAIGMTLALPFSTRTGLRWGPVSVGGSPYFRYSKFNSLNSGALNNVLRPLMMVEPRPIFNLDDDWLANGRVFPAWD